MFEQKSQDKSGIVISSRVRLARNYEDLNFPIRLEESEAEKVIEKTKSAIYNGNLGMENSFTYFDMRKLSVIERQVLVEKHLISPDLAGSKNVSGAIVSKDESISIMINEEDHLRIQCIFSGMKLEEAWELSSKVNKLIEEKHEFAFNKKYGYLTSCPTNIGTGIRASVMLHLPALTMTGYINRVLEACARLGLASRGIYGEKSESHGSMFQISNQKTLGQTEEWIVSNVHNIAVQIIEQEESLRNELYKQNPYSLEDKVMRAFGVLSFAKMISSEESLRLLSDVRLGVDMGMIRDVNRDTLDKIMVAIQPASIQLKYGDLSSVEERDILRAKVIKELFNN